MNYTETIDRIINELATGTPISEALSTVYTKRKLYIPYKEEWFNIDVRDMDVDNRIINCLMRSKLRTLNDMMEFISDGEHKVIDIKNMGVISGMKLMEYILDYTWDHMDVKERAEFLIDVVVTNERYLKA